MIDDPPSRKNQPLHLRSLASLDLFPSERSVGRYFLASKMFPYHPWDDCILTYMNGWFFYGFHVGKYTIYTWILWVWSNSIKPLQALEPAVSFSFRGYGSHIFRAWKLKPFIFHGFGVQSRSLFCGFYKHHHPITSGPFDSSCSFRIHRTQEKKHGRLPLGESSHLVGG